MMNDGTIELYEQFINFSQSKIDTNTIRCVFQRMASYWHEEISNNFYKIFSDLDTLYKNGDDISHRIRLKSIEEGMTFLTANGIYDIAEQQFYEQYMSVYDTWAEEFDVIASQYEAIVERTAELDAYRTARRKNRRQWVGYGSKQAVYAADADNLMSNIGHGAFNLVAKGFTAIGNSIKKDEIFKNPSTTKQIANGVYNIVIAAFNATVDAVNSRNNNLLYNYSTEEISKVGAIIENINKDRIPKDNILSSLIKAMELYPYDKNIYYLLLRNFGSDESRLDETVAYFGLESLSSQKKQLFAARRSSVDLASLEGCRSNIPELKRYAKYIGFDDFNDESEKLLKTAIKREFEKKLNLTTIKSVSDCKANVPILIDFANEIGYQGFEEESIAILNHAIDSDFKLEVAKYTFKSTKDCDEYLPKLESFANEIGYAKFEEWSNQIRSKFTSNSSNKAVLESENADDKSFNKPIAAIIIVTIIFLSWITNRAKITEINLLEDPLWAAEGIHINTDKGVFHMYGTNIREEIGNAFANAKKGQCLALETEKDFDFSNVYSIKNVKACE